MENPNRSDKSLSLLAFAQTCYNNDEQKEKTLKRVQYQIRNNKAKITPKKKNFTIFKIVLVNSTHEQKHIERGQSNTQKTRIKFLKSESHARTRFEPKNWDSIEEIGQADWTNRDDEPEIEGSLLGLEDVEDVGGVPGELVERNPNLLLRVLHRNVHRRHCFHQKWMNEWMLENANQRQIDSGKTPTSIYLSEVGERGTIVTRDTSKASMERHTVLVFYSEAAYTSELSKFFFDKPQFRQGEI